MSGGDFDFAHALNRGLGRAILRGAEVDRPAREEALLHACTRFTGYDFQCNGSRAHYLFDALVAADALERLQAPILRTLEAEAPYADREQVLDLAELFAFAGHEGARQALQSAFVRWVSEAERPGALQVVRTCGLSGLRTVAEELGRVLDGAPVDWNEARPIEVAEAQFGEALAWGALECAAAEAPRVRRYLDAVVAHREAAKARPKHGARQLPPWPLTFEALRAAVEDGGRPPPRFMVSMWGKKAPAEELARAAAALEDASPGLRLSVLWAFRHHPFPAPPEPLLAALQSGDEATVDAAWAALSLVRTDEVRERALWGMRQDPPEVSALSGLRQDLRAEDVPLVLRLLESLGDPDENHAAGSLLLDAAADSGGPHFAPLLQGAYEQGNCGICRRSLVGRMEEFGVLPAGIHDECRYDADLALRADAWGWSR